MKKTTDTGLKTENDAQASSRKEDHISMAFESIVQSSEVDNRFYYEPILSGHPEENSDLSIKFLGRTMNYPIWISSMTGGTEKAKTINENLGRLCGAYGLGMGLGSCRQLLYEDQRFEEFNIRPFMPEAPLCINLGIAQIEELFEVNEIDRILLLQKKLDADALIIHINPLQEWLQPEGDVIKHPPLNTIQKLLEQLNIPIIVKEVGQGFGKESLRQLLQLPIEAVDLAGFGGTNFSRLELLRSDKQKMEAHAPVFNLGHTCTEMLEWINEFKSEIPDLIKCKNVIFSGGIKNYLDGYYHIQKSTMPSLYAQASGFLKYAMDYDELEKYLNLQIEGYKLAHTFLRVKD